MRQLLFNPAAIPAKDTANTAVRRGKKSHNGDRYRTAANCSNTTVELKRDVGNVELHHYHDSICHGIAKTEWKGFPRAGQGRTEPYGGGAVHR